MKKSIKRWLKKIGCTVLATAVLVCSIPNQVYVYPGQMVRAEEIMEESSDNIVDVATQSENDDTVLSTGAGEEPGTGTEGTGTEGTGTEGITEVTGTEVETEGTTEVTGTEVVTEGTTEGVTEGTTEGVTEGTTEGVTEGTTEGVTEGTTEGVTEGTTEGVTEGTTEGVTEDTTEGVTEGTTEGVTEGTTEGTTEDSTEGVTEGTTEDSTEGVTEDTTEDNSTECVTEEASIEVSLEDSNVSVQSYDFDELQGAYTKATVKVDASASYTKANDDTSDEEAAELINDYAIKIDASAANAGIKYIDLSAGDLEGSRELDVTSDGTAKVEISVVKKNGDAYETVSEPIEKIVDIKMPSLSMGAVKTEINNVYDYDETTNTYQSTATATAKVSFTVSNANEEQKQRLINGYTLCVTDSEGHSFSQSLSDAVNENGVYQVTLNLNKTFKDDTNYNVNAELQKNGKQCDGKSNHASSDVMIRIPRLTLNEITVSTSGVSYEYLESSNSYQAKTTVSSKAVFAIQNTESVEKSEETLLGNYKLIVKDSKGKTLTNNGGINFSNDSEVGTGVYQVTFNQEVIFTSDVDGYVITAEVYKKNGNAYDQVITANTSANPVAVKIPRLSLGTVVAQVNNVAYEYDEVTSKYKATATAYANVSYKVENSTSVEDSVQKLTQGYVFYAEDSEGKTFKQNLSTAIVDEYGEYQVTFSQDKVFVNNTDYVVTAELKKNGEIVKINDNDAKATAEANIRLSDMVISEVTATVSDITYEYVEDTNSYKAKGTVSSTVTFSIENSSSAADSIERISEDYKLVLGDSVGKIKDKEISFSKASEISTGVYRVTLSEDVTFDEDVDAYVVTAEVYKNNEDDKVASQSNSETPVAVKIPRIALGDVTVDNTIAYIHDAEKNTYAAKSNVVVTTSYEVENEDSVVGSAQVLASKYTLHAADNQDNVFTTENGVNLSTATKGEDGVYRISISGEEKTFTQDIEKYIVTAEVVNEEGNAIDDGEDTEVVKIPRVTVDCVTANVGEMKYVYNKTKNCYQARGTVSAVVDYTIENSSSLAESIQELLQNYTLVVTDNKEKTKIPENSTCFWNDTVTCDDRYQVSFSTEVVFDEDVADYTITADVLMNGTSTNTATSEEDITIKIPRIGTMVLKAPLIEATKDVTTDKQVFYDEKDETYKVMKKVTGSVELDVINADETQADNLLNGYKLIVQTYQTRANGEDVQVGKGVETTLKGTGKQIISVDEVLTLTEDGAIYAVAKLVKDNTPVTDDMRTDGPTINIPKITVTTSEVSKEYQYVEHDWYEIDKWFSTYLDVSMNVNYEVSNFVDDTAIKDDNEALQKMLETSSVILQLKNGRSGKEIEPIPENKEDTKVTLANINQETGYELAYRVEVKEWTQVKANVIVKTPKNTQKSSGGEVEIHIPSIHINKPTATIKLAGYQKNEAGVYEALVNLSGNVPFHINEYAPSTTTEGQWRTASDAFFDTYKVQLTLVNSKGDTVAESVEKKFTDAERTSYNESDYTLNCNLGMNLSTLLDKDETYTAVYTVYYQAEDDKWEVYQTNKVEDVMVTVGIPEITFDKKPEINLEAEYKFNPQNDEHSFDVSVDAELDYNFFAGTADLIDGTVGNLLADYKVSFALYDGETLLTEVPATEKVFSDRNSTNAITFSGNFNTTRTLQNLKAVVTTWHEVSENNWVKVDSASNEASINTVVIPTNIELKSEAAPAISIMHNEALCNHEGSNDNKVTFHELQVEGEVVLTFSGLTGLDVEQRKAEIANRVKASSMTVYEQLADTSEPCLTVDFENCKYEVIATETEDTYQVVVTVDDAFKTWKSGNHTYYTDVAVEVLTNEGAQQVVEAYEADTHKLEIKELPQNFSFEPKNTSVVYAQDLAFMLTQASDLYVGDFTYNCYKVEGDKKELYATGNSFKQIDINTESVGKYYIEFTFGGDAIYEKTTDSTEFTINKAPITTVFYANCKNLTKSHELTLTATMNVVESEALKRYMTGKDIKVLFTAVPTDKKYQTITLAESEILFNDETKNAVVTALIPHSITKMLDQEATYTLRAEIKCGKEFPYTNEYVSKEDNYNIVLTSEGFKVTNLNLLMSNDGETMTHTLAYTREYKASVPTYDLGLSFYEVQNNNKPVQEPIKVTYTSSDESVATVDENGIVTIHTAGTTDITVVADDATDEQNVYNQFVGVFKVTILSPADTKVNLSVNGTTAEYANVQKIYDARDAFVTRKGEGVYWYDEDIVITIPEGSEYNKICYSVNGGSEQTTEGNTLVIDNELFADYQFRLIHDKAKLNSLDASADKGVYKKLNHVAIDKNAPEVEDIIKLTSEAVKSEYSSETLEYYSAKVQLTVNDDDKQENEKVFDYQSGVKSIRVEYGKDGKYVASNNQDVTYTDDACYFDTFTFDFDDALHNYSTVKVIVTDNMNKETEVIFRGTVAGTEQKNEPNYEGTEAVQICVDTNEPDLAVVGQNADTDKLEKAYEGEWTDEQVNYSLSVTDLEQVVSGIQAYQYAVLAKEDAPEGDVDLTTLTWEEIPADKLEVLFGIVEGEYDETIKDGSFIYTTANGDALIDYNKKKDADKENTTEPKEYKLNGTVYFRAISNSGLIGNVNKEIKIWQTEMDAPNVYANNIPAETGWYNEQTKSVTLRFEYPKDYIQDVNAPAVGLCYEFAKTDENGQTTITKPEPFMIEKVEKVEKETPEYVAQATISILDDSMNILKIYNLDEAGNKSEVYQYTLDADYNPPVIEHISYNDEEQTLYESGDTEDIVYTVFTQNSINVTTDVTYGISQKKSLKLQQCKKVGEGNSNSGKETESLTIGPNARGFIYAVATDVAGNQTIMWANGYVADSRKPSGSEGIAITAPAPNAAEFYNADIPLKIDVSDVNGDDYAGLKNVTYSITRDGQSTVGGESLLSFPTSKPTWSEITQYGFLSTDEVIIDAEANEGNEVVIRVNAMDNASNEAVAEKKYMIDITNPVIDVTFDTDAAVNGTYYNRTRTARIAITERNFDPSKVKFAIYKDGVEVSHLTPSNWDTNEMTHTAVIAFAEDGDYSFTVDCTDLADNKAEQVTVDEFTVDITAPVVEVAYDQDTPWSDNYFNTARIATITVTEHNFNEADFTTVVEPHVALSNWTHNGDTHRATLSFTQDNHYTLNMDYVDMAGNAMEPFVMQDFYIDTQVPEISLSGVEDHSANAGTVIPVITTADTNYDTDGLQITLTDSTGAAYIVERVVSVLPNGYQYTLSNVDGLGDQIYTLSAVLTDKAGNSSEISCRFSLNRNGSTYDLQEINKLVETKYLRYVDIEDLHVTEMNVDKIENFSVYMNKAGEVLTKSQAGPLPSKLEADVIYYDVDVLGNDETGYEYVYTLYRENFESEGIYNLMFYSKDRAGNEVNNTLTEKGAEITFVVDNTAPTVVIDGIEGGEFYAEEYRDVNVYVSDYTQLVEAIFYLVDEDGVTVETYNYLELAENAGDVVTIRIPSNDKSLHLDYTARDIAGNELTSITISDEATPTSFMITTNKWLQLRNNETALTGIIIGGVVVVIMIPVSVLYFRRRRIAK